MAQETVRLKGGRELHRALKRYNNDLKVEFEHKLAEAGQIVETAASVFFSGIDPTEASGYKTSVRGFGRVKVQGKRSKGMRGDFGALLMRRTLLPALSDNAVRVTRTVENMLDTLGREFNS